MLLQALVKSLGIDYYYYYWIDHLVGVGHVGKQLDAGNAGVWCWAALGYGGRSTFSRGAPFFAIPLLEIIKGVRTRERACPGPLRAICSFERTDEGLRFKI